MENNRSTNIHGVRSSEIVAGEAAASASVRKADLMPKSPDSETPDPEGTKKYLEHLQALGFEIGKDIDDLFLHVTFPLGWTKESDEEDSRHLIIKDDKGRKRIEIFYKNTYYDRSVNCSLCTKYCLRIKYDGHSNYWEFYDTTTKESIFRGTPFSDVPGNYKQYKQNKQVAKKEIDKWLEANYPDYKDPLAYWN